MTELSMPPNNKIIIIIKHYYNVNVIILFANWGSLLNFKRVFKYFFIGEILRQNIH